MTLWKNSIEDRVRKLEERFEAQAHRANQQLRREMNRLMKFDAPTKNIDYKGRGDL
jgi:hypothetical protein